MSRGIRVQLHCSYLICRKKIVAEAYNEPVGSGYMSQWVRGPLHKMYSFKRSFLYSLRVDKRIEIQIERVKEFSPEMDFFSSSTVMPQRDLTGQDYFLITPLVIFKPFKVSQERKR
jgi:hypothetical protein